MSIRITIIFTDKFKKDEIKILIFVITFLKAETMVNNYFMFSILINTKIKNLILFFLSKLAF